jgi:hypothetical protein
MADVKIGPDAVQPLSDPTPPGLKSAASRPTVAPIAHRNAAIAFAALGFIFLLSALWLEPAKSPLAWGLVTTLGVIGALRAAGHYYKWKRGAR